MKWTKVSNTNYFFEIDGLAYDVGFSGTGPGAIEVYFSIDKGPQRSNVYTLSGTGNQYKVLITVIDIIRDFIKINAHQFDDGFTVLTFSSKTESRSRVYERLIQRFLPKGWAVEADEFRGSTEFFIGPRETIKGQ